MVPWLKRHFQSDSDNNYGKKGSQGDDESTHSLNQVVVGYLREEMMNHMGSNVMVNVVDPPIIPIYRCKTSS